MDTSQSSSVSADEVQKFESVSNAWWDTEGPFKYLHAMNRTRIRYISDRLADLHNKKPVTAELAAVDVGCGGGLASEALARLGMRVTGVDAGRENVAAARAHAALDPIIAPRLRYVQATAEQMAPQAAYDVVVALEVIEHVADPARFVADLVNLAAPGAAIFVSTMSRTTLALLVDVVVPEYLLNVVPRGTHDHAKFVTPAELARMFRNAGAVPLDTRGLILDPLSNVCHLAPQDLDLLRNVGVQANYIMCARRLY